MKSIIVVGTDTDVGKTFVCSWLMRHLPYTYWKPVASGVAYDDDTLTMVRLSEVSHNRICPSTYKLKAPLSPHWAAEEEGIAIDISRLQLPPARPLLVEGAGGILTPLNLKVTFLDWIKITRLPVLIVARDHIGTINHTCLTIRVLRQEQVPILGVIVSTNGDCLPDPRHGSAISHFGQVPLLATLPFLESGLQTFPIPETLSEALS